MTNGLGRVETSGWTMILGNIGRFLGLALRPAAKAVADDADVRVYVLLPSLGELLGEPGFGCRNPIVLPGHRRPLDGWALFGTVRERGLPLH